MKNAEKHLTTIALVAAGVLAAGYAMAKFSNIGVVSTARAGYRA